MCLKQEKFLLKQRPQIRHGVVLLEKLSIQIHHMAICYYWAGPHLYATVQAQPCYKYIPSAVTELQELNQFLKPRPLAIKSAP